MQCIRRGLPRAGLCSDAAVSEALRASVGGTSFDAVTALVRLGSSIQHLVCMQHEIPYSCGDMMDVVVSVIGVSGAKLELRNSIPLPVRRDGGNVVSVVVETAAEVIQVARDSLEEYSVEAVTSDESLANLVGRFPLQAVLTTARARFALSVNAAFDTDGEPGSLFCDVKGDLNRAAEECQSRLQHTVDREVITALEKVTSELTYQKLVTAELASSHNLLEAATQWDSQAHVCFDASREHFSCMCAARCLPMSFAFGAAETISTSFSRHHHHTFFEAFAEPENLKPLLLSAPSAKDAGDVAQELVTWLGGLPVVLQGADLSATDTYWARACGAARADGFGVIIISGTASKSALDAALDATSHYRLPLVVALTRGTEPSFLRCGSVCVGLHE